MNYIAQELFISNFKNKKKERKKKQKQKMLQQEA